MWGLDQRIWFDRLDSEHDNLRAALTASLAADDPDTATRMATALEPFCETRGYIGEDLGHLRRVLAVETGVAKVSCAKALFAVSRLVPIMSPLTDERPLLEGGRDLVRGGGRAAPAHLFLASRGFDEDSWPSVRSPATTVRCCAGTDRARREHRSRSTTWSSRWHARSGGTGRPAMSGRARASRSVPPPGS